MVEKITIAAAPVVSGPLLAVLNTIDASLILSIKVETSTKKGRKKTLLTYSCSAVAVSCKRALTALHGKVPLNNEVKVTTRNGSVFWGKVVFEKFEESMVDIAVVQLNKDSGEFQHFVEWSSERVFLTQELYVIGLTYGSYNDHSFAYARKTTVDVIEELGPESALFQASYYSFQSCSGAGVIASLVNGVAKVVGVHIASHEDSTTFAVTKKKKRSFADF